MERAKEKTLFLKWSLLNAVFVVFLVVLGITFGGRIHGAPLVVIPVILALAGFATGYGGWLCWRVDAYKDRRRTDSYETPVRARILHDAAYLDHFAWVAPMLGILSSIAGMSILLSGSDPAQLHDRITSGGGAIFYGTFVGVLTMLLLKQEERMIEHSLGG